MNQVLKRIFNLSSLKIGKHEIICESDARFIKEITNSDKVNEKSMKLMVISLTCDVSKKEFHSSDDLDIHKFMHSKETYSCSLCNKNFISLDVLSIHNFIHSGETYSCVICNKEFQILEVFSSFSNQCT